MHRHTRACTHTQTHTCVHTHIYTHARASPQWVSGCAMLAPPEAVWPQQGWGAQSPGSWLSLSPGGRRKLRAPFGPQGWSEARPFPDPRGLHCRPALEPQAGREWETPTPPPRQPPHVPSHAARRLPEGGPVQGRPVSPCSCGLTFAACCIDSRGRGETAGWACRGVAVGACPSQPGSRSRPPRKDATQLSGSLRHPVPQRLRRARAPPGPGDPMQSPCEPKARWFPGGGDRPRTLPGPTSRRVRP